MRYNSNKGAKTGTQLELSATFCVQFLHCIKLCVGETCPQSQPSEGRGRRIRSQSLPFLHDEIETSLGYMKQSQITKAAYTHQKQKQK